MHGQVGLQGGHVRHDHSVAKALNRGGDIPEGDQADFLEDHGFVIKTEAIAGMTSVAGRCHTFDSRADGFCRGEGCSAAVVRRGEVPTAAPTGQRSRSGT